MRSTLIERETIGRSEHDPKTDICMGADAPDPPDCISESLTPKHSSHSLRSLEK